MLASTVQFSNNDQPPITPGNHRSSLGPALKATVRHGHTLRHPTACPASLTTPISFPRPRKDSTHSLR
ncbi:hypothetical protein SAMN06272781_4841 [Streptomyces sp. 1222.2]|nr:hypothetical protein SAMN06272781_4241 [Streptomyces sp. 1222.2]SOD76980.1 hypothetical protein SAMN06272781_4841 [Streptomyces sp. 1222.2]